MAVIRIIMFCEVTEKKHKLVDEGYEISRLRPERVRVDVRARSCGRESAFVWTCKRETDRQPYLATHSFQHQGTRPPW